MVVSTHEEGEVAAYTGIPMENDGDVYVGVPIEQEIYTGVSIDPSLPRRRRPSDPADEEAYPTPDYLRQSTRETHESLVFRAELVQFLLCVCVFFSILGCLPHALDRVVLRSKNAHAHQHYVEAIKKEQEDHMPAVQRLTIDTFDDVVAKNNHVFVNFDTSWCSHCKHIASEWAQFAQFAREQPVGVTVAHVDCADQPQLCREQGISAYPTLRWFTVGQVRVPQYQGRRTATALLHYTRVKMRRMEGLPFPDETSESTSQVRNLDNSPENAKAVTLSDKFPSLRYAMENSDVVLLYFAAGWCWQSTPVTQMLDAKFGDILLPPPPRGGATGGKDRRPLSLVYVSSDVSEKQMHGYMRRNWMAVPFESEERGGLKKHFKVAAQRELRSLGMETRRGELPTILVLSARSGEVVTYFGAKDLMELGGESLIRWMKLVQAKDSTRTRS